MSVSQRRKDSISEHIPCIFQEGSFPSAVRLAVWQAAIYAFMGVRQDRPLTPAAALQGSARPAHVAREGRPLPHCGDATSHFPVQGTHSSFPPEGPRVTSSPDGAYEEAGHVQDVGLLVAVPRANTPLLSAGHPSLDRLQRHYRLYHAAGDLPPDLCAALVERRQQIGQVGIIGANVPYISFSFLLAGRDVIHWIVNTSALAASMKGYSGSPDSARLVHTFHA